MFATTEQRKARLLDLTTSILEMARDGKRDYDEVIDVFQVIKDDPKFSASLRRFPGVPDVIARRVWGEGVKHVVDCDADPFTPDGWKVEEHKKGGHYNHFELYVPKIKLHLSPNQMNGKVIGNDLCKELASEPVLNANVLDYLLAHPELIPEEWKKDEKGNTRYIFFWGTIYRRSHGSLCVRSLCFHDGAWLWSSRWLAYDWDGLSPAAVLAS